MKHSHIHTHSGQRWLVGGLLAGLMGIGLICFYGNSSPIISQIGIATVLIGILIWIYGALKFGRDVDEGYVQFWKPRSE